MIHAPVIESAGCSPGFNPKMSLVSPGFILKYQHFNDKNRSDDCIPPVLDPGVDFNLLIPCPQSAGQDFFFNFFILLYRRYYSHYVSWYKHDVLYHKLIVKELLTDESIKTAKVQQLA
jgi:hypothetical protein